AYEIVSSHTYLLEMSLTSTPPTTVVTMFWCIDMLYSGHVITPLNGNSYEVAITMTGMISHVDNGRVHARCEAHARVHARVRARGVTQGLGRHRPHADDRDLVPKLVVGHDGRRDPFREQRHAHALLRGHVHDHGRGVERCRTRPCSCSCSWTSSGTSTL